MLLIHSRPAINHIQHLYGLTGLGNIQYILKHELLHTGAQTPPPPPTSCSWRPWHHRRLTLWFSSNTSTSFSPQPPLQLFSLQLFLQHHLDWHFCNCSETCERTLVFFNAGDCTNGPVCKVSQYDIRVRGPAMQTLQQTAIREEWQPHFSIKNNFRWSGTRWSFKVHI